MHPSEISRRVQKEDSQGQESLFALQIAILALIAIMIRVYYYCTKKASQFPQKQEKRPGAHAAQEKRMLIKDEKGAQSDEKNSKYASLIEENMFKKSNKPKDSVPAAPKKLSAKTLLTAKILQKLEHNKIVPSKTVINKSEKIKSHFVKIHHPGEINLQRAEKEEKKLFAHQADPKKRVLEERNFLLGFNFSSPDAKMIDSSVEFIKTLSFIFHFHCYNLACRHLNRSNQDNHQFAYDLRTLIVHYIDKISAHKNIIVETQKVIKNHTQKSLNDHYQQEMKDLPIYQKLYNQNQPVLLQDKDFCLWIKNQVLPFMNFLYSAVCENESDPRNLRKDDYLSALKMMIIILGEYCAKERCNRIQQDHPELYLLMSQCRYLRNQLAHKIIDITKADIDELIRLGKGITDTKNSKANAKDTLLTPTPKVSLMTSTSFVKMSAPGNFGLLVNSGTQSRDAGSSPFVPKSPLLPT